MNEFADPFVAKYSVAYRRYLGLVAILFKDDIAMLRLHQNLRTFK